MGRRKRYEDDFVLRIRLDPVMWNTLQDIAGLESLATGRCISACELIRQALGFVFEDNERMRETFKRVRKHLHTRQDSRRVL